MSARRRVVEGVVAEGAFVPVVDGDNPLYRYGASLENLMRYCERMRARYFPETLTTLAPRFAAMGGAQETNERPAPKHAAAG